MIAAIVAIEVGYMSNAFRYMGTQIGCNFANTFGPGASINSYSANHTLPRQGPTSPST
jgi:hypothetical protein